MDDAFVLNPGLARTRLGFGRVRAEVPEGRIAPERASRLNGGPLRVLMVSEACGGGAGRHVLDLSEGLLERGCEVHLVYSPHRVDRFFRERLEETRGLRSVALPVRREIHPSDLRAWRFLRRYLRDAGPFDVVHGHSSKGGALARLAGLGTETAVFYTLHGLILMDPGLSLPKRTLYHAIEWGLSHLTSRIVAVSPEEQRWGVRSGLGRSRVILIPNGVDAVDFPSRTEARRTLGIPLEGVVVGFIGRLVDQKAPEVLIEAFASATRASANASSVLAMVGSGPLEARLRSLSEGLGVSDRVLWLGEQDGRLALPAFDLLALSSRKEGLPYVVLEALSAGLPVVATSAAGVEVLIEEGRNGRIVPPDQPAAFGEALASLISNPLELERLGRASLQRASRFTRRAMVERTLNAYVSCLPSSATRGTSCESAERSPAETSTTPVIPSGNTPIPLNDTTRGGTKVASKPRSSEMHPGPGFRVKADFTRLDTSVMEDFREYATPDISDLLNRLYAVDPAIRCLTRSDHVLCGPACTVKVFPGDNLMVHKALDVAQPGDIVVVDAAGSAQNAVLGDLISTKAKHRGIAGFIVDGLVRDLPSIVELDFPVFARGTTPVGPLHRGPGEINYPICCGGVVVNPGDLIVADAAGIIVIPREIAPELLERLKLHHDANLAYFESVKRGDFSNQWVDRLLEEHACPIHRAPKPVEATAVRPDGWLEPKLDDVMVEHSPPVLTQTQDLH